MDNKCADEAQTVYLTAIACAPHAAPHTPAQLFPIDIPLHYVHCTPATLVVTRCSSHALHARCICVRILHPCAYSASVCVYCRYTHAEWEASAWGGWTNFVSVSATGRATWRCNPQGSRSVATATLFAATADASVRVPPLSQRDDCTPRAAGNCSGVFTHDVAPEALAPDLRVEPTPRRLVRLSAVDRARHAATKACPHASPLTTEL